MFIDLNIPIPQSFNTKIPTLNDWDPIIKTINEAKKLGYKTVALNQSVNGKFFPTILDSWKNFPQIPNMSLSWKDPQFDFNKFQSSLVVLRRLTIRISDPSQNYGLTSNNTTLGEYDIVAVAVDNEKTFMTACGGNYESIDIISLDVDTRLSFIIKQKAVAMAIEKGYFFELPYNSLLGSGSASESSWAKKMWLANAMNLVRSSRGKGLVVTSNAPDYFALRMPYDITNLMTITGLNSSLSKLSVTEYPRLCILHSINRRFAQKSAIIAKPITIDNKSIIDETDDSTDIKDLNAYIKADLIALCKERGLTIEGTKESLIEQLVLWMNRCIPVPVPSIPTLEMLHEIDKSTQPAIKSWLDTLDPKITIPESSLVLGKKIGSGGFKDCFEGKLMGETVAVAKFKGVGLSYSDLCEIDNEVNVLKQLYHENITKFIGLSYIQEQLCIVSELCENGDLYDYMHGNPNKSFNQQVSYIHDISIGVSYLHSRHPSIIHRDLKPMNILISRNNRAKITDFGLAKVREKRGTMLHTACGTPNWQAPEFWSSNPVYNEKVDVYACALLFWEILQWTPGLYPYNNLNEHEIYYNVKKLHYRPQVSNLYNQYPKKLVNLITEMWDPEPDSRPSMSLVVECINEYFV
ncbi:hypothetical protein BB559_004620 [Furculomyces boomerangus]|uniref:Protein kinase domain-containing protein n=1 Tax=Furculomyces boomerangus TaxID=61424 RepID=A0A2T9YDR5_9FUNG|nr:hypothetical protein BB559_004620 [Furculomyces boomerangus]